MEEFYEKKIGWIPLLYKVDWHSDTEAKTFLPWEKPKMIHAAIKEGDLFLKSTLNNSTNIWSSIYIPEAKRHLLLRYTFYTQQKQFD